MKTVFEGFSAKHVKSKKGLHRVLCLVLALCLVAGLMTALPPAASAAVTVPPFFVRNAAGAETAFQITRFELIGDNGASYNTISNIINQFTQVKFDMDFSIATGTFSEGSKLVIALPTDLEFGTYYLTDADLVFEVKTPDEKNVVAEAEVDKELKTLTLTFKSYVENAQDITGKLWFWTRRDEALLAVAEKTIIVNNGFAGSNVSFGYKRSVPNATERFTKYGDLSYDDGVGTSTLQKGYYISYGIRVNAAPTANGAEGFEDITKIIDSGNGLGKIHPDSIRVLLCDFHENSDGTSWVPKPGTYSFDKTGVDAINNADDRPCTITLTDGGKGFELVLDPAYSGGIYILYRSYFDEAKGPDDKYYRNTATIECAETEFTKTASKNTLFANAAGGNAYGYNYGITITKKGADTTALLSGAEFELRKTADGSAIAYFEESSTNHGTYEVTGLLSGTYYIVETTAPRGYELYATATEVTIVDANEEIEIINVPIPDDPITAEAEIDGKKVVAGLDETTREFTFTLTQLALDSDDALQGGITDEVSRTGAGDFKFELDDLGVGFYRFVVEEKDESATNWTYDGTKYIVTVDVSDVGAVTVKYFSIDGEQLKNNVFVTFTNTYNEPPPITADAEINGKKVVAGLDETNREFTFTLTQVSDETLDELPDGITDEVSRKGAGDFKFELEDLGVGVYRFVVAEKSETATGWTYDGTKYLVIVTVDRDGEVGVRYFSIENREFNDNFVTFTNTYRAPYEPGPGPSPNPNPDPDPEPSPDPDTDPEPTPNPEPEREPVIPPPQPSNPDNTIVPGENGSYIELDEDGVPLGEWKWDDELEEWVFDAIIPLGSMPPTGDSGAPTYLYVLAAVSLAGIAAALKLGRKKRESGK